MFLAFLLRKSESMFCVSSFIVCAIIDSLMAFLLTDWLLHLRSSGLCVCPLLTSVERVEYWSGRLSACLDPLLLELEKAETTLYASLPWVASICLYCCAPRWSHCSSNFFPASTISWTVEADCLAAVRLYWKQRRQRRKDEINICVK